MSVQTKVTGVILAGGLARRMNNQDKGLLLFKGQPMIGYAIAAATPLVDSLIVNANRNRNSYEQFGWPVMTDLNDHFEGPLAGILAAMKTVRSGVLLVMPCDSPLIQTAHLQKLLTARTEQNADIAVAFDGERLHPVFLALKVDLQASLETYLMSGQRKITPWLAQHEMLRVDFSDAADIFVNVNTLPELLALERC